MGSSGLEPPTSRLSGVRSNHLSYEPILIRVPSAVRFPLTPGGDERNRTDDPLLAKQVLSQLSYTPISREKRFSSQNKRFGGLKWTRTTDLPLIRRTL